ncbi:mitochondrial carrier protein domain-containing protein [Trichoderma breve]|uniref:Mitochondrial carrier protein domain-containing protein n=1 Tax=Trichoderma breve TaxID=2034170 RepID=A0A9W9E6G2_9HYPO|nr:mitochondrial carrier protein domain-containing protein [Trichoderma breve]KAJ4858322.1 mitochondrial carrier protein domain-containing protein [Trichoderma breve]
MKEIYLAGAAAAFTVDVLIYPLDTLKTRHQSQDFIKSPVSKPLALRGLYQGIGSVILATLPAASIFFSTYETAKGVFGRHLPVPEPVTHSLASAVAEMASCLVLTPGEVIKQNAQIGLFTGYSALVARNLPFTALQFPLFENLRKRLWNQRLSSREDQTRGVRETGLIAGASAGMAGGLAAFVTTPSDVIKTRMMRHRRIPFTKTVKDVWRERGIRGFFRGGAFRSAWTAVGSGLYLGMYDAAKLWLERRQ